MTRPPRSTATAHPGESGRAREENSASIRASVATAPLGSHIPLYFADRLLDRASMSRRLLLTGGGTGASNNLIRSLRAADPSLSIASWNDDRFVLKKSA